MRKYRKVSSETRSLISSVASQGKASLEVNRTFFNKANGSTALEVYAISLEANTTCDEVSQETRKTNVMAQSQYNDKDQSRYQTPLKAQQT